MPIKFRCDHCGQLMGIARRKAGSQVQCPKCGQLVTVPKEDRPDRGDPAKPMLLFESPDFERLLVKDSPVAEPALSAKVAGAPAKPPLFAAPSAPDVTEAQTADWRPKDDLRESSDEVVAAPEPPIFTRRQPTTEEATPRPSTRTARTPSPSLDISVPLALTVVIAVGTFVLGVLVGHFVWRAPTEKRGPDAGVAAAEAALKQNVEEIARGAQEADGPRAAPPATGEGVPLTGAIRFKKGDGVAADSGAIVLVMPADQNPDQKIEVLGLRPEDADLKHRPGREQLARIGGQFGQVEPDGGFRLQMPQPGQYFVLVVSRNATRPANANVFPDELAILRRYFADAETLLGKREYLLITRELRSNGAAPVNHVF